MGWDWAHVPRVVVGGFQPAPAIVFGKQVIDIEVIGPPPHVDAWLLVPAQGSASFGNHFASFHVIMKEIE